MGVAANVGEGVAGERFYAPFHIRGAASPCADHRSRRRRTANPIDVLTERFPVVRRLVGRDSFAAMARRFVACEPPNSTTVLCYGETFPCFIRRQGNSASIEYVADIAELEMVRRKADLAPEAMPVDRRALASLRTKRLGELRLVFHPSVFLVASRFPIVTIWESAKRRGGNGMIERWRAEAALVARPRREVGVCRLLPGGHAFIESLSKGWTVAAAIEAGVAASAQFDAPANLAFLTEAQIVIGIRERARAAAA
jgi:Putative DNA-binding domain